MNFEFCQGQFSVIKDWISWPARWKIKLGRDTAIGSLGLQRHRRASGKTFKLGPIWPGRSNCESISSARESSSAQFYTCLWPLTFTLALPVLWGTNPDAIILVTFLSYLVKNIDIQLKQFTFLSCREISWTTVVTKSWNMVQNWILLGMRWSPLPL